MRDLAGPFADTSATSLAKPGQAERSLADHRVILGAIERGDEEGAARATLAHLVGTTALAFDAD